MSLFAPWSAEKHPPPKAAAKRGGLPFPGGKQAKPGPPPSPPRPNVPLGRAERFVTPSEQLGLTLANLPALRYTTLVLRAADVDPATGAPVDAEAELVRLGMPTCAAEYREVGPAALVRAHTSHECVRRLALCLRQDSEELKAWAWFIKTVNRQLGVMPAFKGVAWKGIQTPPGSDPQSWYSPGQAFRWRTYVSAAKDRYTVPPCNVLVALELDGTLAADVSPLSVQPIEGEVLVAPYQWFKVTESKLLNGTLVVSARTYTPPLREPGYHILWRSDTFDAEAKLQTEIVNLAMKTAIIRSPVYFEKSNDFALALLQHAEDDLEWKVIVSASCMRSFLPELLRVAPNVTVSAIVYSESPKEDLPFVLNYPFVTTITNQHHHVMSFVKCATLGSPEVDVADSDTNSPGSSARSNN